MKPKTNSEIVSEAFAEDCTRGRHRIIQLNEPLLLRVAELAREAGKEEGLSEYECVHCGTIDFADTDCFCADCVAKLVESKEKKAEQRGFDKALSTNLTRAEVVKAYKKGKQEGMISLVNELRSRFLEAGLTAKHMDESEYRKGQDSVLAWLEREIRKYGVE